MPSSPDGYTYRKPGTCALQSTRTQIGGDQVSWDDVYEDLRRTISTEYAHASSRSRHELDMLGTFLLNNRW
jgi:hypothetical protein